MRRGSARHGRRQDLAVAGPGSGCVGVDAVEYRGSAGEQWFGQPVVYRGDQVRRQPSCPRRAERNCQLAGFQATGAPTSNYAFDIHIETGVLGLGSGAVASAVQNLLIMPVWMGLVWVVQALVVALEWCFTIDLLEAAVR